MTTELDKLLSLESRLQAAFPDYICEKWTDRGSTIYSLIHRDALGRKGYTARVSTFRFIESGGRVLFVMRGLEFDLTNAFGGVQSHMIDFARSCIATQPRRRPIRPTSVSHSKL